MKKQIKIDETENGSNKNYQSSGKTRNCQEEQSMKHSQSGGTGRKPIISVSDEADISPTLDLKCKCSQLKSVHGSLPDVTPSPTYLYSDKEEQNKLLAGIESTTSDSMVNSYRSTKSSLEEDYKTIIKIISTLQSLADKINIKYEKIVSNKSNKQLNFRSYDDIINATKEIVPIELAKPRKENRLLNKTDTKRSDDFAMYSRNKNRIDTADQESLHFFFENERLIDSKTNGIVNIRWSDANSLTSPCSTVPESPFER